MFGRGAQNYFSNNADDAAMWLPQGVLDDFEEPHLTRFEPPVDGGRAPNADVSGTSDGRMRSKILGSLLFEAEDEVAVAPNGPIGGVNTEKSASPTRVSAFSAVPAGGASGAEYAFSQQYTPFNPSKAAVDPTAAYGLNPNGTARKGPSGPRKAGQGVEEEEQQVASVEILSNGGLKLRVTLLAAGFVIGASGASIREIMRHTGSTIQSWTQHPEIGGYHRPCRVFCIQGTSEAVMTASSIIHEAVERYKELCEGKRRGEFVQRLQYIRGVEFSYQPPPKTAVPNAASVGGQAAAAAAALLQGQQSRATPQQLAAFAQHNMFMQSGMMQTSIQEPMQLLASVQAQQAALEAYKNLAEARAKVYAASKLANEMYNQMSFPADLSLPQNQQNSHAPYNGYY
mmetsp:Transcript_8152/g.30253  ORF Transcript_8152/g.30253 Transcript_8152/m.30253 type:complete len:399 (-) Transcript_8152:970-2166(-)